MYRRILNFLNKWKADEYRKPLILHGARQVGKTYALENLFAPSAFPKSIYVDFRRDADVRRFVKNHPDAKEIIDYLSLRFNASIDKDTLLIFDEAQEAVQILTAAKYFAQDFPEIPVIITGSLVRLRLRQIEMEEKGGTIRPDPEIDRNHQDGHNNFLYPVGKVQYADLYALTFDEFLLAYNPKLYEAVKQSALREEPLDSGSHSLALQAFSLYLQIGGMPEVVDQFLKTGSLLQARRKVETLFGDYLADMGLYQISSQTIARTRMVWESVYAQLSKDNKNFKISSIEEGKRYRDYLNSFDWLELSRLVLRCRLTKQHVSHPLTPDGESVFRIYLPDCGLFAHEAKIDAANFQDSVSNNALAGYFYENYVAEELSARGIPLFYWKGKTSSELEFLLESPEGFVPIDAKKNSGKLDSLQNFAHQNSYAYAIKVSANRFGYAPQMRLKTIPFYALPFYLDEHFAQTDE